MERETTPSFANRRDCAVQSRIISSIVYISNTSQPIICVSDSCIDVVGYDDYERLMMRFSEKVKVGDAIIGAS